MASMQRYIDKAKKDLGDFNVPDRTPSSKTEKDSRLKILKDAASGEYKVGKKKVSKGRIVEMKKGGKVSPPKKRGDIGHQVFLSKVAKQMKESGQPFGGKAKKKAEGGSVTSKKKKEKLFSMKESRGQGQSVKPFGLTRVRDKKNSTGSSLMVTPTDPIVKKSPDSLTNRKKKLMDKVKKLESEAKKIKDVMKKADGGKLKTVPEGKKGLSKLPTPVRNKMGFMKKGGIVKMKGGGAATKGMNFNRGY